ncbi:hypothetical protein [Celeribacter sp.]|uniref:hypothetical protein n=1 Tax=Celeribacter sp. TaxID=1890673 RepID=UPI003A937E11
MQIMANIYCLFILGVIAFQIALIIGAPWGRITQGGQHEGALPLKGRLAAAISVVLLLVMALAILSAAGGWPAWPKWIGWAAAALNGVVMALNWATPSSAERKLWGPITSSMFVLALAVVLFA